MAKSVLNICRICLQKLEENVQFYFLNNENGLMLQSKLLNFLPEFDLKVTQNPIICKRCTTTIDAIYKFKQLCLRTETIIKDFVKMQQKPFKDVLNYVTKDTVHETIKDELVEDTVLDEPQIVDDDCLQVNTDLPVCIEAPTKPLFYCYTCSYHTNSKTNLAQHIHTVHETFKEELVENTIIKDELQIVDDDCLQLNKNLPLCIEAPTKPLFYCYTCNYHTDSKTNLARHVHSHKKDTVHETFKEEIVEDTITDELQIVDDDCLQVNTVCNEALTKPLFYCYTCCYYTDNKRNLARHVHSHRRQLQKIRQFKCDECGYTTPNNYSLTAHKKIHLKTESIIKDSQMQQKLVEDVLNYVKKDTIVDFEDTIMGEQYIVDDSCLQVNTDLPLCIEAPTKPQFYCYTCNYNTDTKSNLIQHVHTHRSQLHQRNISDYKCATRYKLTVHMNYKCSECDFSSMFEPNLKTHVIRVHNREKLMERYNCGKCDYSSMFKPNLKTHVIRMHNTEKLMKNHKCDECDYSSVFKQNLTSHVLCMHSTEKLAKNYKCGECNYSSEFEPYLNSHVIRMHYSKKKGISYKCDECNYSSMIKHNFKRHMNRMHNREKLAKNYKCDECDYSSMFKGNFKNHVNRLHNREKIAKTYKCSECDYSSVFKHSLKRHVICMHSTEKLAKSYKCGECDYSSVLKENLRKHVINMHNREHLVKNHKCNVCEYATTSKTGLVAHIRSHTGEKPYKCNICDCRFTENSNLKKHLNTHASEKPFKCEHCSYACTQKAHLKLHQQQHLKKPVLDCDKCSFKTLRNFDLKQHQLTHISKRAYS